MKTKGEVLINGLDQMREGLALISNLDDGNGLIRNIIGSQAGAQRLKDVMQGETLLYNLVTGLVAVRNKRLSEETVRKVVNDFLDVLFDLSKPYRELDGQEDEYICPHGYTDTDQCPDCCH